MVDWLHCNLCFIQPGAGANFSLTNCGHIYCEKCLVEGCQKRCRMCGANCTIIRLSSNMKPEVEMFFSDPVDIVRKCMKQVTQVFDFQKNHRRRMISYLKDKLSKQQEVLDKAQLSLSQYQHLEREIIKLREENSYLKRLMTEKGIGTIPRPGPLTPSNTSRPASASSPGSYRASPTRSPGQQTSPYFSQRSQHLSQSQMSSSQGHPVMMTSPMKPGRISIRTPPSGGRIGSSQSTPVQDHHHSTPLLLQTRSKERRKGLEFVPEIRSSSYLTAKSFSQALLLTPTQPRLTINMFLYSVEIKVNHISLWFHL